MGIPEKEVRTCHYNYKGGLISEDIFILVSFSQKCANLKFIYSEKATKFCEIFTLLSSYVVPVKSKVKISQKFCGLLRIYELY